MIKINEALKGIELTDEQAKSLKNFMKDFKEELTVEISESFKAKQQKDSLDPEIVDKAFNAMLEDAKKAFNLGIADAEKEFKEAKQSWEEETQTLLSTKQEEYTEAMTKALRDLYSDVEDRVKADFFESQEFKTIQKIKDAMKPFLFSEDEKHLLEELEELKLKAQRIEEEKTEITKENIIETLLKDIPKQYQEHVRGFISDAKTEEDIYKSFNAIIGMIGEDEKLKAIEIQNEEVIPVSDDKATRLKKREERRKKMEESFNKKKKMMKDAQPIFEDISNKETKKINDLKGFSEQEKMLMELAFPKQMV